jgi:hypothetical protein
MLDSAWLSPTKPGTAQESRSVFAGSNSGEFFHLTAYKLALHLLSETKKKYEISFSTANALALENCKATFKLSKRMPADSGRIHGTQAQRHPAFSFTESAMSPQLSGYLFGLGIAVKAHLSKIWRSLCYRSKFHPKLLAVNVNFNAVLILPQEFCQ